MATIKNAQLLYETGVTPFPMQELTDSGDHKKFNSSVSLFSQSEGNAPDVRPDGIITGDAGAPAVSGSDDLVDAPQVFCFQAGTQKTVAAATDLTCLRGATTDTHRINSITINSSGAYAVVSGIASTAFSETRGAAGGPPYIPVGSIEAFQVRLTSITSAPVTEDEIFAVIGTHRETYSYPSYKVDHFSGEVNLASALPLIHTGDTPKKVYASYAEPVFLEQENANEFVPAVDSSSTSSEQTYSGTDASVQVSLNGASFNATLEDGITDDILKQLGNTIFVKFFPDKFKSPYVITQGHLSYSPTNTAGGKPKGAFTLAPEKASERRAI